MVHAHWLAPGQPVLPILTMNAIPGCLLLLVASAAVCRSHAEPRAPEVRVEAGALRGKWVQSQLSKRNIAAFEGIPYAEPPVGPLRFQVSY